MFWKSLDDLTKINFAVGAEQGYYTGRIDGLLQAIDVARDSGPPSAISVQVQEAIVAKIKQLQTGHHPTPIQFAVTVSTVYDNNPKLIGRPISDFIPCASTTGDCSDAIQADIKYIDQGH